MSCNGCRVLRKGCGDGCVLRPCLQWIESGESQGFATLFVAKFFGRSGLMDFLNSVPHSERTFLFQSLLYEACGRTVNPVHGAVGLLWSGKWHVCQEAVQTVLSGGTLRNRSTNIGDDENDNNNRNNNKVSKRSRCSRSNNSCSNNLRSSMQDYHSLTREHVPTSNGCLESDQEVQPISTQSRVRHCGYNLDTLYKPQNLTPGGANLIQTFDSHDYGEVNFDLHHTPLSKSKLYPHKRPKLNIIYEQHHMTNKRSDIDYNVKANYNVRCIPNECRDIYLYNDGDEKIKLDLGLKSVDHIFHQGASYGNNINNDTSSVSSPSSGSIVTTLESLQQSSIASHHKLFLYDDISNMPHRESPQTNFKLLNLLV